MRRDSLGAFQCLGLILGLICRSRPGKQHLGWGDGGAAGFGEETGGAGSGREGCMHGGSGVAKAPATPPDLL